MQCQLDNTVLLMPDLGSLYDWLQNIEVNRVSHDLGDIQYVLLVLVLEQYIGLVRDQDVKDVYHARGL